MWSQTTQNDHTAEEPDAARIAGLETELADMRDRWIRAEAETANVRTRSKRDVDEVRQFAVQKFAGDVVQMADNLKRGIASVPAPSDQESEIVTRLREGFSGIEHSFLDLLDRNGIKMHDPTGAPFDPELHQAMDQTPSADHGAGTILQAWTPSWTLNGRLLRPAMVVVSTALPPATSPSPTKASAS